MTNSVQQWQKKRKVLTCSKNTFPSDSSVVASGITVVEGAVIVIVVVSIMTVVLQVENVVASKTVEQYLAVSINKGHKESSSQFSCHSCYCQASCVRR